METLSVVVPCYNEQDTIPIFYKEITKVSDTLSELEFEFIFINDGSNDNTINEIKQLKKQDNRVHYISFSRNFGKEAAIYAGLNKTAGDYIVLMDVDLQDPPDLIIDMYRLVKEEGYDSVATRRTTRKGEPPIRSLFAKCFYRFINKISRTEFVDGARDYRLMTRQMANAILNMTEYNRFTKGIYGWVGFKTKWLEYVNVERAAGETKWSFWKLFKYSIDGIIAFSTAPLALASIFGFIFCIVTFILAIFIMVKLCLHEGAPLVWPCLIFLICLISSVQMFCIGILGHYMARIYMEIKARPIFIVKEEE